MKKSRLEAFSDGVIAIIITIMVLELKVPHGATLAALQPLWPVLACYLVSFIYVGIYWNNHHHLLQVVEQVNGTVLWANLHLLFWLSLLPFVTRWVGETGFAQLPVAAYGVVLLCAGVAYTILTRALLRLHAGDSLLARALGADFKGKVSLAMYVAAIPLAFVSPWLAAALYVAVAIIWLLPDRRIERVVPVTRVG
ncbi:MAG: TMEM175 family protein [Steroidobacteraceae bacterium]